MKSNKLLLKGATTEFEISDLATSATVGDLVARLAQREECEPAQVTLVCKGKVLSDRSVIPVENIGKSWTWRLGVSRLQRSDHEKYFKVCDGKMLRSNKEDILGDLRHKEKCRPNSKDWCYW